LLAPHGNFGMASYVVAIGHGFAERVD